MVKRFKTGALLTLGLIVAVTGLSCGGGITQEEYDALNNELTETEAELGVVRKQFTDLQNEPAPVPESDDEDKDTALADLKALNDANLAEIETLKGQATELTANLTGLQSELKTKLTELASLEQEYDYLFENYLEATKDPDPINAADVEEALFNLINQARTENGLDALIYGEFLYETVTENSLLMATVKETRYSTQPGWQEVFWAAGYDTAEAVANAALLTWKNNLNTYNQNILNANAVYGAVSAYKVGDIIFISYISHTSP